jgi:hypothetical protein
MLLLCLPRSRAGVLAEQLASSTAVTLDIVRRVNASVPLRTNSAVCVHDLSSGALCGHFSQCLPDHAEWNLADGARKCRLPWPGLINSSWVRRVGRGAGDTPDLLRKKDHPVALVSVVRGSNARPPFRGRKNKMTSRSAIKQVGIAAALGLASVLTCVSPASAATDIMKAEPFNANKLMLSICNGRTTTSYWCHRSRRRELLGQHPRPAPREAQQQHEEPRRECSRLRW